MEDWQPTNELRQARRGGTVILQRKWAVVVWPHEPYREKGEEQIYEEWRDEPIVDI